MFRALAKGRMPLADPPGKLNHNRLDHGCKVRFCTGAWAHVMARDLGSAVRNSATRISPHLSLHGSFGRGYFSVTTSAEIAMHFEDEQLSNILHAIAAVPFGFAMIALFTQFLQYA